jgi:NDP-sugar pyrophosphorylase family protein
MIFSAGLGTRFRPWTENHPKALALINGKSLLQRNIEYLQQYGIRNAVVNVHHFAEQIIQTLEQNEGWGSRILISDEREALLETGGGLLKARHLLEKEPHFATINVDILTDLNIHELFHFHQKEETLISLGVTDRPSSRKLLFDPSNRLIGWKNTATDETRMATDKYHGTESEIKARSYSCVAVFNKAVFPLIRQQGKFSIIDTYLDLAAQFKIVGYEHSGGRLIDVGKPEAVAQAEKLFP